MSIARRLAHGYGRLLTRLAWGIGAFVVLALLATAITLPLWLLASYARTVYNVIFAASLGATIVALVILRRRRSTRSRATRRTFTTGLTCTIGSVLIVAGIVGRSTTLIVIGTVAFTVPTAWLLGTRR